MFTVAYPVEVCGSSISVTRPVPVPDPYRKLLPDPTEAAEGVPLEVGTDASGKKTRMMGLPDCQNSFKIGLAV